MLDSSFISCAGSPPKFTLTTIDRRRLLLTEQALYPWAVECGAIKSMLKNGRRELNTQLTFDQLCRFAKYLRQRKQCTNVDSTESITVCAINC